MLIVLDSLPSGVSTRKPYYKVGPRSNYMILYKLPISFLITDHPNIPTLCVCWTGNPNTMGLLITDNESTVHCIIIQCLEHGPISYLSQDIARN